MWPQRPLLSFSNILSLFRLQSCTVNRSERSPQPPSLAGEPCCIASWFPTLVLYSADNTNCVWSGNIYLPLNHRFPRGRVLLSLLFTLFLQTDSHPWSLTSCCLYQLMRPRTVVLMIMYTDLLSFFSLGKECCLGTLPILLIFISSWEWIFKQFELEDTFITGGEKLLYCSLKWGLLRTLPWPWAIVHFPYMQMR